MNIISLILFSIVLGSSFFAEAKKKQIRSNKQRIKMLGFTQLSRALKNSSSKNYNLSTKKLFLLMHNPVLSAQKEKIRYQLALDLYNMKLYHSAIFQFQVLVVSKNSRYKKQSLQKIVQAAYFLKNDRLLDHIVAQNNFKYLSKTKNNNLYYQFGEYWFRKKDFVKARIYFSRALRSSRRKTFVYYKTLYQLALVHAELGQTRKAVRIFNQLENRRSGITDNIRVAALIGKARSYYQGKNWKNAIESYQLVPKDSIFWHDTLLENSWALLRSGRLRSALSNFHTMHSDYYANRYQPESLILRAIVYLYICKYYEIEKVLDLFKISYRPVYNQIGSLIKDRYSLKTYYQSLVLSIDNQSFGRDVRYPTSILKKLIRDKSFSRSHYYIQKIKMERDLIYKLPRSWRKSKVGQYSIKLIHKRLYNMQKKAGQRIVNHLKKIRAELKEFFNQGDYLRYEMLRNKRGFLKTKIAQKHSTGVSIEKFDRNFYIQNGYEYWPFQNEYWLDELGNYHYIGQSVCRKRK